MKYIVNGKTVTQEEFREGIDPSRFDDMVNSGIPPGANTDREFLFGHVNGNQFEGQDFAADHHKKVAKAAGVSTTGKVYLSGLAEYPGDPRAWVSGRGDVQKVAEERGWGVEGAVNVKRQPAPPRPAIEVADDLVELHLAERLAKDPALAEKPRDEAKHEVKESLKPKRRTKA